MQLASCEGYMQEHFTTGKDLLHAIQAAWDAGTSHDTNPNEGGLRHLSVRIRGLDKGRADIIAFGSLSSLIYLAQAFAWFCCVLRPDPSGRMSLSTFKFDLTTKRNLSHADLVIDSHLSWKKASGVKSCWHELFNSIMIAYDRPISNRSQFRQFGMLTDLIYKVSVSVITLWFPHNLGKMC